MYYMAKTVGMAIW